MGQPGLTTFAAAQGLAVPVGSNQGMPFANLYGRNGNTYFINEAGGSDTSTKGGPLSPFKTLAKAIAVALPGDTIYFSDTLHLTSLVTIAQNNLAIIGLNGPSQNSRARWSSSGTVFANMVNVTGQGCRFENIGTFYGFADASTQVCWQDTGGRNYYKNVLFGGGGNATAAAQAGMRSLVLGGGNGENLFEDCTFGLDTVLRATNANATLEFVGGGCQRNKFVRSIFQMNSSDAANVHILAGASAFDRNQYFFDTMFSNYEGGGGTQITADISMNAGIAGAMIFGGTIASYGSGKISAAGNVFTAGVVPTGATSGLTVASS